MSVTFSIPGVSKPKFNQDYVCPECKATPLTMGDPSCSICMGYGTDPTDDPIGTFAMNVSNESARLIIREILNYGSQEVSTTEGTLNPTDVLIRLATSNARILTLTKESSVTQGVYVDENGVGPSAKCYEMGYDEERLTSYVFRLREIAEKAVEEGKEIVFG